MFDCDNLKQINDEYGHDKGNIYLQTACKLICNIFVHSPVFILINDFRCRSTGLANAIPVRLLYQKRQLIAFASIELAVMSLL